MLSRYITDGEMQWLFEHCKFVVLPYHEATQSGVLPISYKYGKPVIVSDIPGLRELVIKGKTGEIFFDTEDLKEKMLEMSKNSFGKMYQTEIEEYYSKNYDWNKNLQKLLSTVNKKTKCLASE